MGPKATNTHAHSRPYSSGVTLGGGTRGSRVLGMGCPHHPGSLAGVHHPHSSGLIASDYSGPHLFGNLKQHLQKQVELVCVSSPPLSPTATSYNMLRGSGPILVWEPHGDIFKI